VTAREPRTAAPPLAWCIERDAPCSNKRAWMALLLAWRDARVHTYRRRPARRTHQPSAPGGMPSRRTMRMPLGGARLKSSTFLRGRSAKKKKGWSFYYFRAVNAERLATCYKRTRCYPEHPQTRPADTNSRPVYRLGRSLEPPARAASPCISPGVAPVSCRGLSSSKPSSIPSFSRKIPLGRSQMATEASASPMECLFLAW
jgi:hypothetical protein